MTETENTKKLNSPDLALERTRLASVRTEFALMRTGFSVASFGAGITQLIGRNIEKAATVSCPDCTGCYQCRSGPLCDGLEPDVRQVGRAYRPDRENELYPDQNVKRVRNPGTATHLVSSV